MVGRAGQGLRTAAFATLLIALAIAGGGSSAAARAGSLALSRIGSFEAPVYVDDAPGAPNLVFVVEQPGSIKIVRHGKTLGHDFLDIRDRVLYGGEQGLLSVAFDPGYERNRRFYVYYVNHDGNIEVDGFRTSKGDATNAKESSRKKVIVIPHPVNENHNGGQLQFGPDGDLYLATGDGGSGGDPEGNAQNKNVLLGKLLRIDPKPNGGYSVPKSNPFRGGGGAKEIYALGLRNPYRFSFDSETGDIFIGDVGQELWEEVDHVGRNGLNGANFGWDIFEGNHDFEGGAAPAHYEPPAFEYSSGNGTDNCAVTGGYVVRDFHLPSLAGIYLYGDFCAGEIREFDPSDPSGTDASTGLDVPNLSSFGEGPYGRIYVTSLDGPVYRIVEK